MSDRATVYTDGACLGNPGPGGWAWAIIGGRYASGADTHTTNQRMELSAVLEAARALDGPLDVVSDSTYVVNCFRDRWWEGWLARNWTNKARQPVANRDLWEPLIDLYRAEPARLAFRWVKGHSNDAGNDLVDRLAVEAARSRAGRSGAGVPPDLGEPDSRPTARPGAPAQTSADRPVGGHVLVVAGHRPPELGGYEANALSGAVRTTLTEIIEAKAAVHPDLVVATGLGLGTEQIAAEAAEAAGVAYLAVLAFPDPDRLWPEASRNRFRELLGAATDVVVVQEGSPRDRAQAGAALRRRDAWLARHAAEAVVVWDGRDPGLGRLVRSLNDCLGEEQVWVVEPPDPAQPGG